MSTILRVGAFLAALVTAAALSCGAASAQSLISEFKFGVVAHDVPFLGVHVENGADVNLEALFTSSGFLSVIGAPRPDLGADINTAGNTSDVYGGLTWQVMLLHDLLRPGDGIFVDGSLGGALQNGYEDSAPPGRKRLGSPILFRESAEIGYQITPRVSIAAYLEHMSNANLAEHNAGITSAGGRLGYNF